MGGMTIVLPPSLGEARSSARAELLTVELARCFGLDVEVRVASSYEQLAELAREADLVWAPPQIRAQLARRARATLSVVRGRGEPGYRAALLARRGVVSRLEDLAGLTAAWVSPQSMGGYLLVRDALASKGLPIERLFRAQRFLGSYAGALEAVLAGAADVASIYCASTDDEDVRAALQEVLGSLGGDLEAVLFSGRCPPDGFVVTEHLSPSMAERVVAILTTRCPPLLLESCNATSLRLDRDEE